MTFEDLVEELVGDVFSEHEEPRPPIVTAPDGSATVRGDVPLREVNRALGLSLPESRRRRHRRRPGHATWRAACPTAARAWPPTTARCWR